MPRLQPPNPASQPSGCTAPNPPPPHLQGIPDPQAPPRGKAANTHISVRDYPRASLSTQSPTPYTNAHRASIEQRVRCNMRSVRAASLIPQVAPPSRRVWSTAHLGAIALSAKRNAPRAITNSQSFKRSPLHRTVPPWPSQAFNDVQPRSAAPRACPKGHHKSTIVPTIFTPLSGAPRAIPSDVQPHRAAPRGRPKGHPHTQPAAPPHGPRKNTSVAPVGPRSRADTYEASPALRLPPGGRLPTHTSQQGVT